MMLLLQISDNSIYQFQELAFSLNYSKARFTTIPQLSWHSSILDVHG
jgi:hypothetical protein